MTKEELAQVFVLFGGETKKVSDDISKIMLEEDWEEKELEIMRKGLLRTARATASGLGQIAQDLMEYALTSSELSGSSEPGKSGSQPPAEPQPENTPRL